MGQQLDSLGTCRRIRRDGWTAERQLRFLDVLAGTRSVTRAAAAVGMNRKSAYRLRNRADGALFAAAWDRTLRTLPTGTGSPRKSRKSPERREGHIPRDLYFAELLQRLSRKGHETGESGNPGNPRTFGRLL